MLSHFQFNTIGLFTTNNAKVVRFYCDIFGFQTDWNGEDPNVELFLDNMRIILFPRTAFEQMTSRRYAYPDGMNGTMEISFDVPCFADVDKEYARAVEMGATPIFSLRPPQNLGDNAPAMWQTPRATSLRFPLSTPNNYVPLPRHHPRH